MIFDGTSPLVEIYVNHKGRVACGLDEANNRVNLCFTCGVCLSDGGKYFGSTYTSSINTLLYSVKYSPSFDFRFFRPGCQQANSRLGKFKCF